MRLTYLLAVTASVLALAGTGAAGPAQRRSGAPVARSLAANEIEDSTKTGTVGPDSTGPAVVRAQILLDRARFSPGEIDGVYGDDFGIAVKGYQETHGLNPTGTIDAGMWRQERQSEIEIREHELHPCPIQIVKDPREIAHTAIV